MENIDHVLIVDDDRGIRELIAGYLEKNGMRVSLAAIVAFESSFMKIIWSFAPSNVLNLLICFSASFAPLIDCGPYAAPAPVVE